MKKHQKSILAFIFFFISVFFIATFRPFLFFLPAQQVELSHGVNYGAVLKDFLFVQEITLEKRYLSRVDIYMAKLPTQVANENVFILLDSNKQVLYTRKFSSMEIGEALFFKFDLGKSVDIGMGSKIFACIYSIDGDQQSYIGLARKDESTFGKLYVVSLANNDAAQSVSDRQSRVDFPGSMGVRTYESDNTWFTGLRMVMYLVALAIAMGVIFSGRILPVMLRMKIRPEKAFLAIALLFGPVIVLVSPPFQVPDEPAHFFRAYQVSELNIYKFRDDFPKSLLDLSTAQSRMQFSTHEKTTPAKILSLGQVKLNPDVRDWRETTNFAIPYIPQALGILLGRILGLNPLWLLYLGRIFNLIAAVVLVYLAIKTIPVSKWMMFLLGVMPMTLYQFASLSYDAVTIGLAFLVTATILKFALNGEKQIGPRDLLFLFLLSGLLAASKPPYFIIPFAFVIIPVAKIGSKKRFALLFGALIMTIAVISQIWVPTRAILEPLFSPAQASLTTVMVAPEEPAPLHDPVFFNPLAAALPMLPHGQPDAASAVADSATRDTVRAGGSQDQQGGEQMEIIGGIDPAGQKDFILGNPISYLSIILDTFSHSLDLYMTSFIGLFGWVDTPLPPSLAYGYLLVLLLVSWLFPVKGIQLGWKKKGVFLALVIANFMLVETALYLYCNPVGANPIIAVQGRYFIAFSPLLFLLFYAGSSGKIHHWLIKDKREKISKDKRNPGKNQSLQAGFEELPTYKLLPWFAIAISIFTLSYALYVLVDRFYVVTI